MKEYHCLDGPFPLILWFTLTLWASALRLPIINLISVSIIWRNQISFYVIFYHGSCMVKTIHTQWLYIYLLQCVLCSIPGFHLYLLCLFHSSSVYYIRVHIRFYSRICTLAPQILDRSSYSIYTQYTTGNINVSRS